MAVAKFTSSSCFEAVSNACIAIQRGDAKQAAVLFRSVGDDAKLLRRESKEYSHKLKQLEVQQENKVEDLTSKINDLYRSEKGMEEQERNLKIEKAVLETQKAREERQVEEAERRYKCARDERDEAAEKYETAKTWWWVPLWGWYIGIEELIQDNEKKARDAQRHMDGHRSNIEDAERSIRVANARIDETQRNISTCLIITQSFKDRRNVLHEQLGSIRSMSTFLMEAATFWQEVSCLSSNASMKSDHLQKIMNIASKKNTLKILRSGGTKTMMGSFKECWMEIEDMMRYDNIVFAMENLSIEY